MNFLTMSLAMGLLAFNAVAHAGYETIMTCEGGKVWLDVNTDNRNELQLVSRYSDANLYINRELKAYSSSQSGNYGSFETVWKGTQPIAAVSSAADFEGATFVYKRVAGYPEQILGQYYNGYKEYVSFFRVGNDLKLQVTMSDIEKCIGNHYDGKFGKCAEGTYWSDNAYIGDWIFRDCK